jgi:hypothetical protein
MAFITIHQLPPAPALTGAEELPLQSGPDTLKTTLAAVVALVPTPPAVVSIGTPIVGGTIGAVLFIDGAGKLAQAPATFGLAGNTLLVSNGAGEYAQFSQATIAGQFTDRNGNVVVICDGTNRILYTPAVPGNWLAGTPPTDAMVALDRIAAAFAANGLILP